MKKILPFALVLMLIFMTGCDSNDNTVKVGTIKYLNVTEEQLDEILLEDRNFSAGKRKHIFFDNLNTLTAALHSRQIDEMSVYRTVALYMIANNPTVQWEMSEPVVSDVFCCALREEDTYLRDEFNRAILQISIDGTLAKLVKTYLDESARGKEPAAIELPAIYGEDTIKIGVTGDLPLLDYVRADGTPAGFNTAVLAEISRIIGQNFVLVQVDSAARAIALTSGEVDVIFWAVEPKSGSPMPINFDKPDGTILTAPYFSDGIVHVRFNK